jgi:cystathionine gamma-synthase
MLRHTRGLSVVLRRSCRCAAAVRPQCRFSTGGGRDTRQGSVGVGTASVWAGEEEYLVDRATQVPIVNAVGYGYDDVDEWYAVATGDAVGHIYSRNTNPTVRAFEKKVQALEGAEDAIAFSSGMAAISNTLFALLKPGDRVVSIKDSYGGTSLLFLEFLPKYGVEVELVETSDFEAIEAAVAAAPTALLYLETPTNPTLKVVDIERLAAHAKATWGSIVCVDNTFGTPVNQLPLTLGADIVLRKQHGPPNQQVAEAVHDRQ